MLLLSSSVGCLMFFFSFRLLILRHLLLLLFLLFACTQFSWTMLERMPRCLQRFSLKCPKIPVESLLHNKPLLRRTLQSARGPAISLLMPLCMVTSKLMFKPYYSNVYNIKMYIRFQDAQHIIHIILEERESVCSRCAGLWYQPTYIFIIYASISLCLYLSLYILYFILFYFI